MRQGYRLNLSVSNLSDYLRRIAYKVHNGMDELLPLLRFNKNLVNLYYDENNDYLSAEKIDKVLFHEVNYSSYSEWIDKEIKIAKQEFYIPNPIIAIQPWGTERISKVVKDAADIVVGWNFKSVFDAVKQLG